MQEFENIVLFEGAKLNLSIINCQLSIPACWHLESKK